MTEVEREMIRAVNEAEQRAERGWIDASENPPLGTDPRDLGEEG